MQCKRLFRVLNYLLPSLWEHEIDTHLNKADIILLLISPDFMDSDYCYGIEMQRAMERHERGEAKVIPIILRPVYWQKALFGKLQVLASDAKPVTRWRDREAAFFNVAEGIRTVVEMLPTHSQDLREQFREVSSEATSHISETQHNHEKPANRVIRHPNILLREQRNRRTLTQRELAEAIGTTEVNISRWENDSTFPTPYYRRQLCEFFGLTLSDLGFEIKTS